MLVKNKSGEIEAMHYGPAMEAVAAGTHVIVNVDEDDEVKEEVARASSGSVGVDANKAKKPDALSDAKSTSDQK